MSWLMMTGASAQAGNRAGKTLRCPQWKESEPEQQAETSDTVSPGQLPAIFFQAPSEGRILFSDLQGVCRQGVHWRECPPTARACASGPMAFATCSHCAQTDLYAHRSHFGSRYPLGPMRSRRPYYYVEFQIPYPTQHTSRQQASGASWESQQ